MSEKRVVRVVHRARPSQLSESVEERMTLQERLRDPSHGFDRNESHTEDRYVCLCEHLANEAADALDAKDCVLREIAEEWAGAECGEPVTAQEAYAIELAKRMYRLAIEGLK